MTWVDRLREAAYTPPSGGRLTFTYENLRVQVDKKTSAFEPPDADGTYVQDNGSTGRRVPMQIIFWGEDYDTQADNFMIALQERGVGSLEHPVYGTIDVVPFGAIGRRDDLKTAANQGIIDVTFWETTGILFPTAQVDPGAAVLAAVTSFNDAAAAEFAAGINVASTVEQTTAQNGYTALLNSARTGLRAIADAQQDVQAQFDAVYDSINQGIDVLIAQPLALAAQTASMLQAPARALVSIEARLDGYRNLASSIFSRGPVKLLAGPQGASDLTQPNAFRTQDLYASTYVSGSIISAVNTEFATQSDAIAAAESILAQAAQVTNWRDESYSALGLTDTGGSYQQLQDATALAAGFLVEISFNLKRERRVTLDRARTILDLAAELYGQTDEVLDVLINTNNFSGSEIQELPKGREVIYYV